MSNIAAKPYHHGNLKDALLQAALKLIAEVGPAAFTLREAARRAGVSHNAPYRHFRDKNELLSAVAAQGFNELNRAMLDAAPPDASARRRLQMSGRAYVEFALLWPQHFTVMFDMPPDVQHEERNAAAQRAFGTLLRSVEACQADGSMRPGEPLEYARLAWSLVHGIAKLAVAARLAQGPPEQALDFTLFAVDSLWCGIGAHRGAADDATDCCESPRAGATPLAP